MYAQVQDIRSTWIAQRDGLLADAELLLLHISPQSSAKLVGLRATLNELQASGIEIYRDVFFLAWWSDLNNRILDMVEGRVATWNEDIVDKGVAMVRVVAAAVNGHETDIVTNWIATLTGEMIPVVGAYLPQNQGAGAGDEAGREVPLLRLPQYDGIKIMNRNVDLIHGAEYGYDVDWDFDFDEGKWLASLEGAIAILKRHPSSYELVKGFASYIVPLSDRSTSINISFSARRLPNVIFKNNELSPYLFAETLVHESDHQFYYALEDMHPLWNDERALSNAEFYSPWRDDPRPLDGIMRGLSAFTRVCAFYAAILNSLEPTDVEVVGKLLVLRSVQSMAAVRTLERQEALSNAGIAYVSEIEATLLGSQARIAGLVHYNAWLCAATETTNVHKLAWDQRNVTSVANH